MKCFLVVFSVIAVFSADTRDFLDKSDTGPDYPDEPFPEEPVGTKTAEEPKNIHDKTDLDQQFIEEKEGLNAAQLRGKKENKILKLILKDLEYIKEDVNKELKEELKSIRDNQKFLMRIGKDLNESNSELQKEVSSIKQNIDNEGSLVISKLDSINAAQGCPSSFIHFNHQCFKYLNDQKIKWEDADAKCKSLSMTLAQPRDPVGLRKYLVENFVTSGAWIGARGNGSVFKWIRGEQVISNYWMPGHPGKRISSDYGLLFCTYSSYLKNHPNQPYYSTSWTQSYDVLCEKA